MMEYLCEALFKAVELVLQIKAKDNQELHTFLVTDRPHLDLFVREVIYRKNLAKRVSLSIKMAAKMLKLKKITRFTYRN